MPGTPAAELGSNPDWRRIIESVRETLADLERTFEAAAQRAHPEAHIEIADLKALVGRLQAELEAERAESCRLQRQIGPEEAEVHSPSVNCSLTQVENTQSSGAGSHPDLVKHVVQMLDEIEKIYWADLGSGLTPADVLERLTANLRYAHDVCGRRSGAAGSGGTTLLEQHVAMLMDTKAETSFGRHLAFAVYDLFPAKVSQLHSEVT